MTLCLLELYCGIGGASAALEPLGLDVAGALDVSEQAISVYRANFSHRAEVQLLEPYSTAKLAAYGADFWWLSPPCQPHTRRGLQRDDQDPRAASFLALLPRIAALRPRFLGLENVPGFAGSTCHHRLREVLDGAGYTVRETTLCPTVLGVPMRRRRFYLVASREGLVEPAVRASEPLRPLRDYLDPRADSDPALKVPADLLRRYAGALDILDPEAPGAVTACFTAAYGRSPVRSGSYLQRQGAVRRFSPREILHLLGFPPDFRIPPTIPQANAWRLVGNSLSVDAVRYGVRWLPCCPPTSS